ncbi:MAG: pyridoxamine 5'-phosphate oxidase [Acidimicrobiia bacterium]
MNEHELATMRHEYGLENLRVESFASDPFTQFSDWFTIAIENRVEEPNAMVLATTDSEGRARARTVLLKSVDARGFCFFTNQHSQKGRDLAANPHGSIVFPWYHLERQVVAWGEVEPTSDSESDEYFQLRPEEARIGAWASAQSEEVASREVLVEAFASYAERFSDGEIPRPDHWGGYRLIPTEVEFWQGGQHRLHDRLVYRRITSADRWRIVRLAP